MMGKGGRGLSLRVSNLYMSSGAAWWAFEVGFDEKITLCNQIRLYWHVKPCRLDCFLWLEPQLAWNRVIVFFSSLTLPKPYEMWIVCKCAHTWTLESIFLFNMFCDWNILYFGHPDAGRTIELAELTETRIKEENGASPKILLIQDKQQEATVESAEHRAPDRAGVDWLHTMAVLARWAFPRCACLRRARFAVAWGIKRCTRAVWMALCLCPSAWQEERQPLLRAWFGCHCCQEKEAPSCQHNYLCFLHPPFLMWQLSACFSAQCQGNHHGVGQDTKHNPETAAQEWRVGEGAADPNLGTGSGGPGMPLGALMPRLL
jgi:hypothetical protein